MKYAKDGVTTFYNPTNKLYKLVSESGNHVLKSHCRYWLQCCAFTTDWSYEYFKYAKIKFNYSKAEDGPVGHYHTITNQFVHTILPSFVQHEGYDKSTFGNPPKVGKNLRNSATYDPNFDVTTIDWDKEFADPFINKEKMFYKDLEI
jgi:hypothetical protein